MEYNSFPLLGVEIEGNMKTSTGINTRGLVGYWKLDLVNSSNYTSDYSGYYNDGTLTNMNNTGNESSGPTDGRFGKALKFDAVNDYVKVSHSTSLDVANGSKPFALEAWVYPRNISGQNVVVEKYGSFQFKLESNRLYLFNMVDWSDCRSKWGTIPENSWSHVVVIYDGSNCKFYLNGADATDDNTVTSFTATSNSVFVGAENGLGHWFNGTIDEIKIYNRALTAEELQEDYNPKQSDFRITVEYDKIDIMGNVKFGKGTQKICIEKTGAEGNKAVVSVTVC
jgi:hypothetical protein